MKAVKGNKLKASKTEPETPKQDGVKNVGVHVGKNGAHIILEIKDSVSNEGIGIGLTVEQCNAVAMALTSFADEVASDLSATNQ